MSYRIIFCILLSLSFSWAQNAPPEVKVLNDKIEALNSDLTCEQLHRTCRRSQALWRPGPLYYYFKKKSKLF